MAGAFPPLDLPLDVFVELYYDYCWDDVSTTSWPPASLANNSQKLRCELWREGRAEWETNHSYWLYNACSPGACGATAHSGTTEWLNFACAHAPAKLISLVCRERALAHCNSSFFLKAKMAPVDASRIIVD